MMSIAALAGIAPVAFGYRNKRWSATGQVSRSGQQLYGLTGFANGFYFHGMKRARRCWFGVFGSAPLHVKLYLNLRQPQ
jgi:hypothetical protein